MEQSAFIRGLLNDQSDPQIAQYNPQAGWDTAQSIGGLLASMTTPGAAADAAGYLGGPSIRENVGAGHYGDAALQALGLIPGAGLLGKIAGGAKLAMFLGPTAKLADKVKLGMAEKMAGEGASREAIWDATGWFQGVDGKWRFEIPDDKSFFYGNKDAKTVGEALKHDQLYENYPSAKDLAFEWSQNPKAGYSGAFFSHPQYRHGGRIDVASSKDAGQVTTHELQHYVDNVEGNKAGASPQPVKRGAPEWDIYKENAPISMPPLSRETFAAINGDASDRAYGAYLKLVDKENKSRDKAAKLFASKEGYRRDASEVLARATEARMDLNAEQRAARYPWLDYDVPEDKQIVRGLLGR